MVRTLFVMMIGLDLIVGLAGCKTKTKSQEKIWEQVKIGELAPPSNDRLPPPQVFSTVVMDIHILELPADRMDSLKELWPILSADPIKLSSYNAFTENGFRIRFGHAEVWPRVQSLLAEAGALRITTNSMALTINETTDMPVAPLPLAREITFVGTNLLRQTARVGAGILTLRLRPEPIPGARGVHKVIGYPTYTIPVASAITALREKARENEYYFAPAAFAVPMAPGDLVVLGPDRYTGERQTLGGLFFSKPEGTLFFNPSKRTAPQIKPAVRLYVLICTAVND